MKHMLLWGSGAVIVIGVIIVAVLLLHNSASANAQPIPDGTYFKTVKQLSRGTKPACLSDNKTAADAVNKLQSKSYSDSLDLALGTPIPDMPAGVTQVTTHSFMNNRATGTETFSDKNQKQFVGDLTSFNYIAQVDPSNHHWKLISFIACK